LAEAAFYSAALLALPGAALADPDSSRQKNLIYLLVQDCGSCHGMTLKGGLGPPLLPDSLEGKNADDLADIIINGIPGTPMPPWAFEISLQDAIWLAQRMKEGIPRDR